MGEEHAVRHLTSISKGQPKSADAIEDSLCAVTTIVVGLIRAIGGNLPVGTYLETKCNFGIPVDET